jgi:hypothetical protein
MTVTTSKPLFKVDPNIPIEVTDYGFHAADLMEQVFFMMSNSERFERTAFYVALHHLVELAEHSFNTWHEGTSWEVKTWVWDLCPLLMGVRTMMMSTVQDNYESYIQEDQDAILFDYLTSIIAEYFSDVTLRTQYRAIWDDKRPIDSLLVMSEMICIHLNRPRNRPS